jgi:hypothetical protein
MTTSAAPVSNVAAGWYVDPSGAPIQRWWDGRAWTDATQPNVPQQSPVPMSAPTASPVASKSHRNNPYNPVADRNAGVNTAARNALVFGIICMIINPLLLPSIGAIIWGIVGISRANQWVTEGHPPTGKGKAIWGLVLGSIGLLFSLLVKGLFF